MDHPINKIAFPKLTFALLALVIFCVALDISIIGPLMPVISEQFNVPVSELSYLISLFVFFGIISAPIISIYTDRIGIKIIFTTLIFIFAISTLSIAFLSEMHSFYLSRSLQGIASGGIFPIALALIQKYYDSKKRGLLLGLIGSIFGIAFLLGPIIAGLLIQINWQLIFLFQGLFLCCIPVLFVFFIPRDNPTDRIKVPLKELFLFVAALSLSFIILIILRNLIFSFEYWVLFILIALIFKLIYVTRNFFDRVQKLDNDNLFFLLLVNSKFLPIIMIALLAGMYESVLLFIPAMVVLKFSLNPSDASFMMLPIVFSMVIGSTLWGYLLDKNNPYIILRFGLLLSPLFLILLIYFSFNVYLFVFLGIFLGIALSAFIGTPIRYAMMALAPKQLATAPQGLISFLQGGGRLVGASLFGLVIAIFNESLLGYESTLLLCIIITAPIANYFLRNKGVFY